MTDAAAPTATATPLRLAVRACGIGLLACATLLALALGSGLLPAGTNGYVALGVATASLSGCLALSLQTYLSAGRSDDPMAAPKLVAGMVSYLLVQAVVAVAGCLVLSARNTQFPELAAFGLSFAAAAMAFHIVGALIVARALMARTLVKPSSHPVA
ncbi:MAG: hypothetical protein AAF628_31820 [Planctomycetota bacterium]